MAKIKGMLFFNGTNNDDEDTHVTNVVKLFRALDDSKKNQFAIYRDGLGNDKQWSWITRWFSRLTGWGGSWIMNEAYTSLKQEIDSRLADQTLTSTDTLHLSTCGFSRGAAIARHFVNEYLQEKLTKDYPGQFHLEIGEEYLLDTVASFGIPIDTWIGEQLGIYTQQINLGWNFAIPNSTKAYHALSLDEKREAYTPTPIELKSDAERQELYFSGDHSTVGGGHAKKDKSDKLGDRLPMHYMAKRMMQNGFELKPEFIEAHHLEEVPPRAYALGRIAMTKVQNYPCTQIEDRSLLALKNGTLKENPKSLVHWSVAERIKTDSTYNPLNLFKLCQDKLRLVQEDFQISKEKMSGLLSYRKKQTL